METAEQSCRSDPVVLPRESSERDGLQLSGCVISKTQNQLFYKRRDGPVVADQEVGAVCHTQQMTTPQSPGDGSQEPRLGHSQPAPTAVYPGAPQVQFPPPKASIGLALAALLVGVGAFLFGLIPVFGALLGIAAIVLGVLALRKQQSKVLAIIGLVLGGIGALTSLLTTLGLGAIISTGDDTPPAAISSSVASEPDTDAPTVEEPTAEEVQAAEAARIAAEAEAEAARLAEEEAAKAAAEAEAAAVPAEHKSALIKATSYSEMMQMSKAGIYDQLTSEYGEQFSAEAAQYAIDTMQADWNANALAKAKSYQEQMAMSPESIRDQLTSAYGEQFTQEEADYAIGHLND